MIRLDRTVNETANLSKGKDAKLKGLHNGGSQFPSYLFFLFKQKGVFIIS
jgi:hypothetical protein